MDQEQAPSSPEEEVVDSHEDNIAKAQEVAGQEQANRTLAANFRQMAAESAGGQENVANSDNPLVKELMRQAGEFDAQGDVDREKANLDFDARQAVYLEKSADLLKGIVANERAIARGEKMPNFISGTVDLPEGADQMGLKTTEASREYRDIVYKTLGVDGVKVNRAIKRCNSIPGTSYVRTALPHTFIHIGQTSPSNSFVGAILVVEPKPVDENLIFKG